MYTVVSRLTINTSIYEIKKESIYIIIPPITDIVHMK